MTVAAGLKIAVSAATPAFHARLRARFGLAPSQHRAATPPGLAYCGREFRIYPFMRIGEAVRLFSALQSRWNADRLREDFALCRLADSYEIRRMKRAYQRALVLALAVAPEPAMLVVENAEEFDEAPAAALLERVIARAPAALVTFAGDPPAAVAASCDETLRAIDFESRAPA